MTDSHSFVTTVRSLGRDWYPREHSTSGEQKLLGVGKRGNSHLRKLYLQGARAVLKYQRRAVLRPEALAGRAVIAQPLQHRRCRRWPKKLARIGVGHPRQEMPIGLLSRLLMSRPADRGCLTTALEIALRFPHPQTSDDYGTQNTARSAGEP